MTVCYNSNPQYPKHLNHLGALGMMNTQDSREFNSLEEAICFWFECISPITSLHSFKEDLLKRYPSVSPEKLDETLDLCSMREENLTNPDMELIGSRIYNEEVL